MTPARALFEAEHLFHKSLPEETWKGDKHNYERCAEETIAAYEALPPKKKRKFRKRARKTA